MGGTRSEHQTIVNMFQSINSEPEGGDGIIKIDGVYHLRLRFPWEDQIVSIALHGVFTHADALKTFRLFCSWIKRANPIAAARASLPGLVGTLA